MDDGPEPSDWLALLERQAGAVSRAQLLARGITDNGIRAHVAAARWRRALPGVYFTFTGPPTADARQWAALLYSGDGSLLSHETAGLLWRLVELAADAPVHVTAPRSRAATRQPGIVLHRTRRPGAAVLSPPRTSAQITVLDLAAQARHLDQVLGLVARACQRGITTADQLVAELALRPRQRWRATLLMAVADIDGGAHSALELRYLREVERAHRLPVGTRQRRAGSTWQDVHYDGFVTTIELDGRLGHADTAGRWRDMTRDNAATLRGETTLRYGWSDVAGRPCDVAAQVATVLRAAGWSGRPTACSAGCTVRRAA